MVGDRKCTHNRRISNNVTEQTFEISIRNRKNNSTEVSVVERFTTDWEILQTSHTYNQLDVRTVEFPLTVEPDSEEKITYNLRTIG